MVNLHLNIKNADEAREFITECEASFAREITDAIYSITDNHDSRLIMLSGPTCSGKTTTARRLTDRITESGHRAVVMSIDDFFLDRDSRNRVDTDAPDYDSVKAIDLEYFEHFIRRLLRGESVLIPVYDFTSTSRVGYNEYIPRENDIYVFEGIQAVYPEITSLLGGKYRSIFISVGEDISYKGTTLTKNELRLLRRVVRDYKFRGATAEFTLHLWGGVRHNEETNIFPNSQGCSVYLNSLLPYEPFIISAYAVPLLRTVPHGSRYREEAEELIAKMSAFDGEYFEDSMIPADSVFREFIG